MTDTSKANARRRPTDEEILTASPKGAGGNEVRVGIFVLAGLVSFIVVIFLLTDPAWMRGRYFLYTEVPDAGGVRRGDPIQMRGVNVGRVHGFEMEPSGRVAISMEMEGQWRIPVDSRTVLGASGIFGGRTLDVVAGTSPDFMQSGDTIPGSEGGGEGLLGNVDELSEQAGTVLTRLGALLDTGTVASVQASASELQGLLSQLAAMTREQRSTLQRLTTSLAGTAETLESAGPDARQAIARADSTMRVLTRTGESLDAAATSLQGLLGRIDRGEGTLGRLSTDDALYVNMNQAAERLAALLADLKENPKRYINISIF